MEKILNKRNKKENAEYLVKLLDYENEYNKQIDKISFIKNLSIIKKYKAILKARRGRLRKQIQIINNFHYFSYSTIFSLERIQENPNYILLNLKIYYIYRIY